MKGHCGSVPGQQRASRATGRRGSTLVFALVVLLVMSISGLALAAGSMQSLRLTKIQRQGSLSFNLAESGAEHGLYWLSHQGSPPTATSTPYSAVTLGGGTYTVTVTPDPNNPNTELKQYAIVSQGLATGRQETVELYVQLATFGRYAYFTDYERSSITNSAIWFKAGEVIDGPAHSNNTSGSDFNINYVGSTDSIFKDTFTAVSNNINYNPGPPTTEDDFQKVYEQGSRGFRTGVNRIELPDNTDKQKVAAWGAANGFPSTTGVYVPNAGGLATGGIYLNGDSTLSFSVTAEGWQRITAVQGSSTTTITIKLDSNTTVVQKGSSTSTYTGATNGVIYSTGNITSLSGQLADSAMSGSTLLRRNAFTLAADVVNGKGVNLTGNLTYKTQPDKTQAWDAGVNVQSAAMGIVARNVTVDSNAPTSLTVDAVVLAGGRTTADGSFSVPTYNSKSVGTLNLLGGVIQKMRGPVGTFNGSTGAMLTGYSKHYTYDRRMAVNPPPYFPTTGNYERLSFRRLNAGFSGG